MSFVERLFLLCPLLGGSFIGGSTVVVFLQCSVLVEEVLIIEVTLIN